MKRKDALYELLIQYAGTYCSGETLAQELGISRAAVWKAVQTLRTESNVPIQSHPKKGYCIPADADLLTVAAVQPHLKTQYLGRVLYTHTTINSTNTACKQMGSLPDEDGWGDRFALRSIQGCISRFSYEKG